MTIYKALQGFLYGHFSCITETNTPIYYSKKDIAVWIQYLECLFAQNSLNICLIT